MSPPPVRQWQARLDIHLNRQGARTVLAAHRHSGPLRLQRPFYPEGSAVCHLCLLHPPGGLVMGDELSTTLTLEAAAEAVVTTPSAGKFYGVGDGPAQRQCIELNVGEQATLEWLPQENIYYAGANAQTRTRVRLAAGASFVGWEIICLGRPAANAPFVAGRLDQQWELWRDERPLFIERLRLAADDPLVTHRSGLQGLPVCGTLIATFPEHLPLPAWQAQWHQDDSPIVLTRIDELLVARYLGHSTEQARLLFGTLWQAVRPLLPSGRTALPPRIWNC